MLTSDMISLLWCPTCSQSHLRAEIKNRAGDAILEGLLICEKCRTSYLVQEGVPMLLPESRLDSDEWNLWKQHLDRFNERRQHRLKASIRISRTRKQKPHQAFFEFVGITEGNVLDVGCGPGKLRAYLNEKRVTYYGMDPLPTPDVQDFRFVSALAEHIPFRDSTFSNILVISALDHFNNVDHFFKEAFRVLKRNGRFHLFQTVHEVRSAGSLAKEFAHHAKDAFDNFKTKKSSAAPKHMTEFKQSELLAIAQGYFEIDSLKVYGRDWYTPDKLFISMKPISKQMISES